MRKFIQQKLKDQKGLTLIELLAVIVILAIIAAIAIPAIGNIIENSRVGAIKSDAINVMAAADLYFTDGNVGTTTGAVGAEVTTVTVADLKAGKYLDNAGSFEATGGTLAAGTSVIRATSSVPAEITGNGVVGGIKILFNGANRTEINAVKNSDRPDASPITVQTN